LFGNSQIVLHPDFSAWEWEARSCAPLVAVDPARDAVTRRLNARLVAAWLTGTFALPGEAAPFS
jgi:hypothetical protein